MTKTLVEPEHLAQIASTQTGLDFEASHGKDTDGQNWFLLRPRGLSPEHTFAIKTTLRWRRLEVSFEPGKFARELISEMSTADKVGQATFRSLLRECETQGAHIEFRVNGTEKSVDSDDVFSGNWHRLQLTLSKGQLELGVHEGDSDLEIVSKWTCRFAASIMAILPLEGHSSSSEEEVEGYPEGATSKIRVNRYERDLRNRAAAISIHGTNCQACGMKFGLCYGEIAEGYIEVHHTTPVSQLGENYLIDPAKDLVPLCSNCHSVVHRRNPPLSVNELKTRIEAARAQDKDSLREPKSRN